MATTQGNKADQFSRELDGTPRRAVQLGTRTIYVCHIPKRDRWQLRQDIARVVSENEGNDAVATLKTVELLAGVFNWTDEGTHVSGKQEWVDHDGNVVVDDKVAETTLKCRGYRALIRRVCLPDGTLQVELDKATQAHIQQALDDVKSWTEDDHNKVIAQEEKHAAWKAAMQRKKNWESENVGTFSMAEAFGCFDAPQENKENKQ